MKVRKPMYYDSFQCIGSACQDTCCKGWEIELDEEAAERYFNITGELGQRLNENIVETENEIYFRLQEGKRCPFLNRMNLCDLILECGEDYLCDICREHPRHYQWFGDYTEVGLGLCCEEAGRLLFQSPEKLEFICEEVPEEDIGIEVNYTDPQAIRAEEEERAYIELLLESRELAYALVQCRKMRLSERLILLLEYGEELQEAWDKDDFEAVSRLMRNYRKQMDATWNANGESYGQRVSQKAYHVALQDYKSLLVLYHNMESLDGSWQKRMQGLEQNLEQLMDDWMAFGRQYPNVQCEYEHFVVYMLYRYFVEALFDGDILGKVKFAIVSVLILFAMDLDTFHKGRSFTFWNRIQNAKQYSKEIEYCTDNLESFGTLCWQESCMSVESLTNILRACESRKE